jgi:hypothetical protein
MKDKKGWLPPLDESTHFFLREHLLLHTGLRLFSNFQLQEHHSQHRFSELGNAISLHRLKVLEQCRFGCIHSLKDGKVSFFHLLFKRCNIILVITSAFRPISCKIQTMVGNIYRKIN